MDFNLELTEKEIQTFKGKFEQLSENECWNWEGYKLQSGHGQIRIKGVCYYAYRVAYFLANGSFDNNLCVLHRCDNGACVNPSHLFLGTRQDNTQDMINKDRHFMAEKSLSFLSDEQVIEIFRLKKEVKLTNKSIAKKFDLDTAFISRIINGRRLRHTSIRLGMIPAN